jgi:hypothetical protein
LTAFHLAVQLGHVEIMKRPFFENYPPKESEYSAIYSAPKSTSVLHHALNSCEPEVVWMILDKGIANSQDINNAWAWVSAGNWKAMMRKKAAPEVDDEKLDEIRQLLMTFGGFTPPPTPKVGAEERDWESSNAAILQNGSAVPTQPPPLQQKKKQKALLPHTQQSPSSSQPQRNNEASSPQPKVPINGSIRGRGRGRGHGRGRGR